MKFLADSFEAMSKSFLRPCRAKFDLTKLCLPLQSFVYSAEHTGMPWDDRLLVSASYTLDIIEDTFIKGLKFNVELDV